MHRCHFLMLWVWHIEIQRLWLTDIRASCNSEVQQLLLRDLPNCFVKFFQLGWDLLDVLDRPIVSYKLVLNLRDPKSDVDQISNKMFIHANKLSSQNSSSVNVCSKWLKALIVPQNLRSGCCWHRSYQKRVSSSVSFHLFSKLLPIVPISARLKVPKIKLKLPLT